MKDKDGNHFSLFAMGQFRARNIAKLWSDEKISCLTFQRMKEIERTK